jgi:hypothetical protein
MNLQSYIIANILNKNSTSNRTPNNISSRSPPPSLFINTLLTVKVFLSFLSFYINIICVLHQSDRRYNFHFSLKLVTLKTRKYTFYIFFFLLMFLISFSTPFLYARAGGAAHTRKKIK